MKYQMDAKRNGDDDCVIGSPDGCETRQSDQLFQRKLDGAQKGQLLNTIFQQFQPISTNFKSHLNQIWTGIEGRQLWKLVRPFEPNLAGVKEEQIERADEPEAMATE